jgi:hypothetical protein
VLTLLFWGALVVVVVGCLIALGLLLGNRELPERWWRRWRAGRSGRGRDG